MAGDTEIVVGSLITIACSLGAASLLLEKKRKHSSWVKKYILERGQYGECNTLLPELVAAEVVKCVQCMRMDIEVFEELLSMVEKDIVGLVVSCRFQIPLHGPPDFVCDPTKPTDKIRTCRD